MIFSSDDFPLIRPTKTSEDEHRFLFLDPLLKPIFSRPYAPYEVKLNRAVNASNTKKRPDFLCHVDNVSILNSEVKPLGFTSLQKSKDFIKSCCKAKKSINQMLDQKGGPYQSISLINMGIDIS